MSTERTLDRLSYLVRSAAGLPLSASCVVNRAEVLALVEQALAELPPEVEEAQALLRTREQFLAAAHREADAVTAQARRQAAELVESSAVAFTARARAEEILRSANEEAARVRREADDWCDRRLAGLEAQLERALGELRRGRLVLEHRSEHRSEQRPEQLPDQLPKPGGAQPVPDPDDPGDQAPDGSRVVLDLRDGRPPRRSVEPGLGADADLQ